MKKIIIDTNEHPTMAEIHRFLAGELNFPSYYGNNFDALYDCLTDLAEETEIRLILRNAGTGKKEFQLLKKVLSDAAEKQTKLTFISENSPY